MFVGLHRGNTMVQRPGLYELIGFDGMPTGRRERLALGSIFPMTHAGQWWVLDESPMTGTLGPVGLPDLRLI